jgi:hypothetical protein
MKLVPKHEYVRKQPEVKRSDFPVPMLSRGQLDDVWNPVDGRRYSTLRNYEKAIPKGHHIAEAGELNGGAKIPHVNTKEVERDIATAWDQVEAGYNQGDK